MDRLLGRRGRVGGVRNSAAARGVPGPTFRPTTPIPMDPRTLNTGPYDSDFDDPLLANEAYDLTQDERTMGLLAHLSAFAGVVIPFGNIGGPLLVWLLKRDQSAFVADQAREALNFQITATLAMIVSFVLMFVLIGIPMLIVVTLAWLVLTIVGGVRANEGRRYRYPFTLRLVK